MQSVSRYAALVAALTISAAAGVLMARVPSAYTFLWWIGAGAASVAACSRIVQRLLRVLAAVFVNVTIIGSFAACHGFQALTKTIFHSTHLTGGARRTMISDFLSSLLIALMISLGVAVLGQRVLRNKKLAPGDESRAELNR